MREGSRTSLPSPPLLFIGFFTSHRSPLSERLEQAIFCLVLFLLLSFWNAEKNGKYNNSFESHISLMYTQAPLFRRVSHPGG